MPTTQLIEAEAATGPGPTFQQQGKPTRPSRWLSLLTAIWLVVALTHAVVTGRFWLWVLPALAPPLIFALVPLLLLLTAPLARGRRVLVAAMAFTALIATMPYSGLNLAAIDGSEKVTAQGPTVHVVTLNTDYWGQIRDGIWSEARDQAALFAYLRSLDADVYLLQEHMVRVNNRPQPITDLSDLRREFPAYQAVAAGTLLTLSRLPVAGHDVVHSRDEPVLQFPAPYGLRVDIRIGDRVMSTYNVHMPVQLLMEESPLSRNFYQEIQQRHKRRAEEYRALTAAVAANPLPLLVAGDFNTSPAMGDNRALLRSATDAASYGDYLYPTSWRVGGRVPRLWRTDWALVSNDVQVNAYRFVDSKGNSDHTAQELRLTIVDKPAEER